MIPPPAAQHQIVHWLLQPFLRRPAVCEKQPAARVLLFQTQLSVHVRSWIATQGTRHLLHSEIGLDS